MTKHLLAILICTVYFLSCESNNNNFVKPDGWLDYTNNKSSLGFKAAYPPNWDVKEEGQEGLLVYFMSPAHDILDKMNENVNFVTLALPSNVNDMEGLVAFIDNKMKTNYVQIKLVSSNPSQFHGIDGELMTYEMVFNEIPILLEQHVFIYDNKAYVWTFAAESARFKQYKPTADNIKASFTLVN